MNTQIRFTTVEVRENRLHMQALKQQAEQDALAESQPGAPPLQMHFDGIWHSLHAVRHGLWVAGDELALELGDMLHGHRPHLHHHAH
ncbi:MAG: hypothetical protein JNL34_02365 [Anaerolineae bacterium]|nr:hypothetical protein [Anaerolineae bacterium]